MTGAIEPIYPQASGEGGYPTVPLQPSYFLLLWFNLSDPAVEEVLYDSEAMRRFAGIDSGQEAASDEPAV